MPYSQQTISLKLKEGFETEGGLKARGKSFISVHFENSFSVHFGKFIFGSYSKIHFGKSFISNPFDTSCKLQSLQEVSKGWLLLQRRKAIHFSGEPILELFMSLLALKEVPKAPRSHREHEGRRCREVIESTRSEGAEKSVRARGATA